MCALYAASGDVAPVTSRFSDLPRRVNTSLVVSRLQYKHLALTFCNFWLACSWALDSEISSTDYVDLWYDLMQLIMCRLLWWRWMEVHVIISISTSNPSSFMNDAVKVLAWQWQFAWTVWVADLTLRLFQYILTHENDNNFEVLSKWRSPNKHRLSSATLLLLGPRLYVVLLRTSILDYMWTLFKPYVKVFECARHSCCKKVSVLSRFKASGP